MKAPASSFLEDPILVFLTGGPNAGKSTSRNDVVLTLNSNGYAAASVPEVATLSMDNNLVPADESLGRYLFQMHLATLQLRLEEATAKALLGLRKKHRKRYHGPAVLICDRGILDIAAYLTPSQLRRILAAHGFTRSQALKRYVGGIHLVTAADGAPEFCGKQTNGRRLEPDVKAMLEVEARTIAAWKGHPNRVIVKNLDSEGKNIGFDKKREFVLEAVLKMVRAEEARLAPT